MRVQSRLREPVGLEVVPRQDRIANEMLLTAVYVYPGA
jgi:hypothetical protein